MLDAYLPYFTGRYGGEVELIVVVNGSTDGTAVFVRDYAKRHSQLKVIEEAKLIGKGASLMKGFEEATGTFIGFADADGATPPAAFQDLVDRIGDAGVIIASRWLEGAVVSPQQPLKRRIASRLFNGLVRALFRLKISDTQCGAKLMSGKALKQIMPSLGLTRWAFDVDVLFQFRRAGFRIVEVPTEWHDVKGSKLKVVRASLEMFLAMVRLRLIYSPFRSVVTIYNMTMGRFMHYGEES